MLARLTFFETDRPARQFLLEADQQYLIGRDEACDIHVDVPGLSRRHARLEYREGSWRIADLCSKNGTLIAGRPVSEAPLTGTQWIEFGDLLACFDHVSREAVEADRERATLQWHTSVHLSRAFKPSMNNEELLNSVLASFLELSAAQRGFVMLRQRSGEFAPDVSQPRGTRDFAGSSSVVRKTFERNEPVVCSDVRGDHELNAQASIVSGHISALACVPLRVGERLLGVIYVDSSEPGKKFTELDIDILQALADHAALVIGVSRLREKIVDLSALLPVELDRETPPDRALIERVQQLLPELERDGGGPGSEMAVAGADS